MGLLDKFKKDLGPETAERICRQGQAYYDKGNYSMAFISFENAAELGHGPAMVELGMCYLQGMGTAKNEEKAVKYFRAAIKANESNGKLDLGYCYEYGLGVKKDPAEAVRWYRAAAEEGNYIAQANLAYCYEKGIGTAKDYEESAKWYRRSALQGWPRGQYGLGYCYEFGMGVAYDHQEAIRWIRKAAEQGYALAVEAMQLWELPFTPAASQSSGLTQRDYEEYLEQFRVKYGISEEDGSFTQGKTYYDQERFHLALPLLRQAAAQGHAGAQYYLGRCYDRSEGVPADPETAVYWYKKAADSGYADALYEMGTCYRLGYGVEKNLTQAVRMYQAAAAAGSRLAKCKLQEMGYCV